MHLPTYDLGGSGPPLVISHATGFCGRIYAPLASALTSSFRVFAVDHRGHGHAGAPPDGGMSYRAMAVDLIESVDALGLERPVVVGHSMGATVALLAQQQRPGLFAGAYLYEAAVLPGEPRVNQATAGMIDATRRRVTQFASKADALASFATKHPYRRFRADSLACFVEYGLESLSDGSARLRCDPHDEAECYAQNMTAVRVLDGIEIDATLATGGVDEFGVGLVPPPLSAVLPQARVVVHEHLGHFGPLEAPEQIAADVITALAGERRPVRRAS